MVSDKPSKDLLHQISQELEISYDEREAKRMASWLIEDFFNLSTFQIQYNESINWSFEKEEQIEDAINRLKKNEPIQYITQRAHFFGLEFKVSPATLIPRPETEELVDLILQENKQNPTAHILDVGTGSGCIPISIQKKMHLADVKSIDISEEALTIAQENNEQLQTNVTFHKKDILNELLMEFEKFDVIVSNPPYIRDFERELMHENVLKYEPHLALFVDNHKPLVFYKRITFLATKALKKGGKLYFEINESFGRETALLLKNAGFSNIEIIKDLQGKNRIVKGEW